MLITYICIIEQCKFLNGNIKRNQFQIMKEKDLFKMISQREKTFAYIFLLKCPLKIIIHNILQ